MKRLIRSSILILAVVSVFAAMPSSRAGMWNEQRSDFNLRADDSPDFYSSYFLSRSPAWLTNALPGSRFNAIRTLSSYNRDGDRSTYRYADDVGTLANPFDFSLFNNVASFPTAGGTTLKATSPIVPDATLSTKYWDTTAGAGNGVGGSGTWGTTFSNSPTGDATLTTAGASDDLIFDGTAGTITLSGNQSANSLTFNLTGYKITGNNNTARSITGPITLASNVTLTIGNGEITDITIGVGSISGSAGSGLTINGSATGGAITRLNLASASATISVPVTITGTGFANIAGTATGTQITGTVTGNGFRLNLGATSGNVITFSNTINNGSGAVRIAAGSSGGAGVVTLSGTGNTWGSTELNNATAGILRMGVANALPTSTTLTFGASSGNGDSVVELGGFNTTIGQLTNGPQSGGILRNTSGTAATLTISGSDTTAAAFSGSLQNGTGAGALSLVRSGTGTTTLSGANTYTGGTQINGGMLSLGSSGALGTTGTISFGGGILQYSSSNTTDYSNRFSTAANQLYNVDTNSQAVTWAAALTSSGGSLTKNGAGTLTLSGANSYTGGTQINGGTLSLGSSGALGTTGTISFGGGTLQYSSSNTTDYSNRFSTAANQLYNVDTNSQAVTWAAALTSSGGSLTKSGAGTLVLSGTNTYTAGTTVSSGTLRIDPTGSLQFGGGSDAITLTGSSTIANNGTINQTGTGRGIVENTGGLTLSITNGSATNSSALIQTADADAVRMSQGNSNITLDNYGSIVSLNASAGGSQAIDWANITTGSNTLTNNSTGLVKAFEADAVRPGVNGVITNSGTILSITNTDSGSDGIDAQTNSGISITNSGSGLIEGGRHGITGGNTTGSGAYTMSVTNNADATIRGDNGSGINIDGINGNELVTVVNHGTIIGDGAGDGVDVDGLVNLTNTGLIRSANAFSSMSGGTGHSEGVTVGGGTIINSGTIEGLVAPGNTQAVGIGVSLLGNSIESGPLAGTREAIYGNAVVTNQAGGLIRGDTSFGIFVGGPASGFTVTINNNAGATIRTGSTTDAAIQTGADNDTINNAGLIDGSSSGKAIVLGDGNDTLNITGGSASILGDVSGGTGTNALSIDPGSSNAFSYSGVFSNFNSVVSKSGTVTLSGANTYTGTTQVTGGTLLINGNQSAATGAVSVSNAGSLLGGTGTIGGAVTVNGGGNITGATNGSVGTLTLSNNLTFTGTSGSLGTYVVDLTASTSDLLAIGGTLDLSSAFDQITFQGTAGALSYTLATYSSLTGLTDTFDTVTNLPAGYSLVYLPTELDLVATPIPEPTTWIGAALALGAIGFAQRRRAAKMLKR